MITNRMQKLVILSILSICVLAGCASTRTQSSTGEYIDDSVITTKVEAGLAESKKTSLFDIEVETYKGRVQLSGFVDSETEKDAAEQIANQVAGVREVVNNIQLKGSY